MHLILTQHAPHNPFISCFFCSLPLDNASSHILRDTDNNRNIGWVCSSCVGCAPDTLQAMIGRKLGAVRTHAHRLFTEAEALSEQANRLECLISALDTPLTAKA